MGKLKGVQWKQRKLVVSVAKLLKLSRIHLPASPPLCFNLPPKTPFFHLPTALLVRRLSCLSTALSAAVQGEGEEGEEGAEKKELPPPPPEPAEDPYEFKQVHGGSRGL